MKHNPLLNQFSQKILLGLAVTTALTTFSPQAQAAVSLISGLGGDRGFGENFLDRNDDGSVGPLALPFPVNFYGNTYDEYYLNNNGNITFSRSLSSYTPNAFPGSTIPIIAPYWSDVDTRNSGSGLVYYDAPNEDTVVITWDSVGYYSQNVDLTNSYQLVLTNRDDTGAGNFDIEFRYAQLEWTTGDASGGSGGFGGTEAVAGFDAGDTTNYFTLPGSETPEILDIIDLSNVDAATPGLWSFAVRNGELPGETPDNPLLPVILDDEFQFDFNIPDTTTRIFIDPDVAVGYDFIVDDGPNMTSVLLPTGIGDDLYDLWVDDGSGTCTNFVDSGTTLTGGTVFNFSNSLSCFGIRGIETSAMLDPTDPLAFVTGLTFDAAGDVSMRQVPIVENTDDPNPNPSVPEPMTAAWIYLGLAGLGLTHRLRKKG